VVKIPLVGECTLNNFDDEKDPYCTGKNNDEYNLRSEQFQISIPENNFKDEGYEMEEMQESYV